MNTSRTALTAAGSRLATLAVASVAGYASYRHIAHVATMAGETIEVATVLPLAIDGLIVVASLAMLADKAAGRAPRASARVALGFGIVATLAANIASAQPTMLGRAVAAVPAIAFLLAVEVLARRGKLLPAETEDIDVAEVAEPDAVTADDKPDDDEQPPAPRSRRIKSAVIPDLGAAVRKLAERHPELKPRQLAARLGCDEKTVRRHLPPRAASTPEPQRTAERAANLLGLGEPVVA